TTGDRSAMSRDTLAALRGSNLAHLLAISGLHMGLLTSFVFAAVRMGLSLIPGLALRVPVKKIAAVLALAAGAFYLALSGGNVATQRAFIMVAAMFVAVLFDRRALTLRAVALAALIVLVLRPESLTEPGFQMSFAATTALVTVFGALRDWRGWRAPRWARPALAVVVSSAVAGLATAPFSAATFNQVSHYGLLANLLAVPLMGVVVMPGAVLAAVLAPLGLSWLALAVMRPALEWIMWVAHWVSGLDGAIGQVASPGPLVVPLIALGGLIVALIGGRLRWLGLGPVVVALLMWMNAERPVLLISDTGGLVGVMGPEGRVLNKARGEGFVAGLWLGSDGDPATQQSAAERLAGAHAPDAFWFDLGATRVAHLRGRQAAERVASACAAGADLVILAAKGSDPPKDGRVIDGAYLARTGALAIDPDGEGLHEVSASALAGQRPWSSPSAPRR
ncbi:MAG TPA: ComEC/Rec2 family competence protein, partial [Aliiroseovarius sp.]|nr:ComEC/Rec2 family competence protein [Aliiroseovarius sp.]